MKKKILAVMLAAAMVVPTLSGCGDSGSDKNGGGVQRQRRKIVHQKKMEK